MARSMKTKNKVVYGVDSYNLCMTGEIGRTLATPSGGLNEHIPVVLGCDMYNFQITGDIAANLNASSCNSPTHSGPSILILNDQGGDVMHITEDVTHCIRAQDHGHPPVVCMAFDVYNMQGNQNVFKTLNNIATDSDHIPVVCFEPGILSRDCSAGNRAYVNICSTLRAQMGDNQPAICYEVNNE